MSPETDGGKEDPSVLNGRPQQEDEGLAPLSGQQPGTVKAGGGEEGSSLHWGLARDFSHGSTEY